MEQPTGSLQVAREILWQPVPSSHPEAKSASPKRRGDFWKDLLGDGVPRDGHPLVTARLGVDGDKLVSVWLASENENREKKLVQASSLLQSALCQLLDRGNDGLWTEDEWMQALGLASVAWVRQALLLCRAQIRNKRVEKPIEGYPFVLLPGGQAISIKLFWPDGRGGTNPLNAFPEAIVAIALKEVFEQEKLLSKSYTDADLGLELQKWLELQGAKMPNGLTDRHVQVLRSRLKRGGVNLLPSRSERSQERQKNA